LRIKRVFHHYKDCEEFNSQLWKYVPPETRQGYVEKSAALMLDCAAFEKAMNRVIDEWPNSIEAALSASTMNHQAWMGHAGCAINHDAPEDLTRLAWRTLTEEQQALANAAADRSIAHWKEKYVRSFEYKSNQRPLLRINGAGVWEPGF
jgi:hypothetical protein